MNRNFYNNTPNNRTLSHIQAKSRKARFDALPYPLTQRPQRHLGSIMMIAQQIISDLFTHFSR